MLASRIPWTLVVFVAALFVPWLGSRFYTFLATQIAISALFAVSLNLLLGYTGLVSFGHAAYFGIGAYACGILMKTYGGAVLARAAGGGAVARRFGALVFGFFCVRLTQIYFAMLTLAFAQIVWAICFKWNEVTGGEQGCRTCPIPISTGCRRSRCSAACASPTSSTSDAGRRRAVAWRRCGGSSHSPFGLMLTTIRENPERAAFIGVNVRRYELAAFVVAGGFAGLAGALFGIFNRGVFTDFAYWTEIGRGADHDPPRRHGLFLGPGGRRRDAGPAATSRSPPTPSTGRSCSAPSCWSCCSSSPAASSAACAGAARSRGVAAAEP